MKGQLTFIQGKSSSGKTRLIASSYKKADTLFLRSESVIDYLLGRKSCERLNAKNVVIEDIDFLKGRTATQKMLCGFIDKLLLDSHNVIISGINLSRRVPILFSMCESRAVCVLNLPRN